MHCIFLLNTVKYLYQISINNNTTSQCHMIFGSCPFFIPNISNPFYKFLWKLQWSDSLSFCCFHLCLHCCLVVMRLSTVTSPPPLPGDSGDLPRDSILYFARSKVQPRVLPGIAGDIFLLNPRVGPQSITQGTFGQSPIIYGHPGIVDFLPF